MQATFPHRLLRQVSKFWPEGMSQEPQDSINGTPTIVPTMRGRWMASCQFVLHGEAATLEWQAFLAQMEGRVGTTLVPAHYRFRPLDRDGHPLSFCDVANIAGAQTWTHFGFANTDIIRAAVAAAAPLRATQIDLKYYDTTGLRPGQYFSIGDRLHRVQVAWKPDSLTDRIIFQPPLRRAVGVNAIVEIEKPVCRMRMTTETEGVFDQSLDVLPVVTTTFQEAL